MSYEGGQILAIQTLRNTLTTATFFGTSALTTSLISMGYSASITNDLLHIQVIITSAFLATGALFFLVSIKNFNALGFTMSTVVHKKTGSTQKNRRDRDRERDKDRDRDKHSNYDGKDCSTMGPTLSHSVLPKESTTSVFSPPQPTEPAGSRRVIGAMTIENDNFASAGTQRPQRRHLQSGLNTYIRHFSVVDSSMAPLNKDKSTASAAMTSNDGELEPQKEKTLLQRSQGELEIPLELLSKRKEKIDRPCASNEMERLHRSRSEIRLQMMKEKLSGSFQEKQIAYALNLMKTSTMCYSVGVRTFYYGLIMVAWMAGTYWATGVAVLLLIFCSLTDWENME